MTDSNNSNSNNDNTNNDNVKEVGDNAGDALVRHIFNYSSDLPYHAFTIPMEVINLLKLTPNEYSDGNIFFGEDGELYSIGSIVEGLVEVIKDIQKDIKDIKPSCTGPVRQQKAEDYPLDL